MISLFYLIDTFSRLRQLTDCIALFVKQSLVFKIKLECDPCPTQHIAHARIARIIFGL